MREKAKFAILDALMDDYESFTQILDSINFFEIEISNKEIIVFIKELINDNELEIYYEIMMPNGNIDYMESWYGITEKGKKLWSKLCEDLNID